MSRRAMAEPVRLVKMNGLGNQIVVADLRHVSTVLSEAEARAIDSRPGLHFEQLMVLHRPTTPGTLARIRIYNTDGSAAGACGNGMRCLAWLLAEEGAAGHMRLETDAGVLVALVESPARITVDMGRPRFGWADIPLVEAFHDTRHIELQVGPIDAPLIHSPSVVNVGNPHCIFWVDRLDVVDLGKVGPMLEHHRLFPERANISLALVESRTAIRLATWERGAGLTRACGSAACAAAVCGARLGLTERTVTVHVPGGPLEIAWGEDDRIRMTGPVEFEHEQRLDLAALAAAS
jgi:diaminopimelate epimerase